MSPSFKQTGFLHDPSKRIVVFLAATLAESFASPLPLLA
jgi:hypothetical protein